MIIWRDIIGYEGLYQVSNTGLVKVLQRKRKFRHGLATNKEKMLQLVPTTKGYLKISLNKDGKCETKCVHVLVADCFVKGWKKGYEVNHKDGDKMNNHYSNLEWGSHKHNQEHASKLGLMKSGTSHHKYNPSLHINKPLQ